MKDQIAYDKIIFITVLHCNIYLAFKIFLCEKRHINKNIISPLLAQFVVASDNSANLWGPGHSRFTAA